MGYAYLFALIVGLGILTIQAFLGGKDADHDGHADGAHEKDLHTGKELELGGDFIAMFVSVRFWVFASLGFGLSGTLLNYLTSVNAIVTAITAVVLGLLSGGSAAAVFRYLSKTSTGHVEHTGQAAVGRIARVIVPCPEKGMGKVRIEIGGRTVDLMAKSGGLRIERGDSVVIEEVDGEIVQVCRVPEELRD